MRGLEVLLLPLGFLCTDASRGRHANFSLRSYVHYAFDDFPCCTVLVIDHIIVPFIGLAAILCGCRWRAPAIQWRTGGGDRICWCKWAVGL